MGNCCYTKYRFEGPTREIQHMGQCLYQYLQDECDFLEVSPFTYQQTGSGRLTLCLEMNTEYAPWSEFGPEVLKTWGPHSKYYYYAEEFGLEGAWTNDIKGRYFPWNYAILVWKPEALTPGVKKLFVDNAEYRLREDQYKIYFSYWTKKELAQALRPLISRSDLADDVLLDSVLPELKNIHIYNIRRIRDYTLSQKQKTEIKRLKEIIKIY